MRCFRLLTVLSLSLCPLAVGLAAERNMAPGCRLAANDPLRAEVEQMMRDGAAFEERQRLALEDKVRRLGAVRGWSKTEEGDYLQRLLSAGLNGSWDQTLSVAAAFIQVCEEQTDGNQRADAVQLFREFYVVEKRQWQTMHEQIDRDLDHSQGETAVR